MLLGVVSLFVTSAYAFGSECDDKLTASLHECQRIVGSLRPDKAGQMRVFASDGSEFTAGQAQWMKGQLAQVAKACDHGNVDEASKRLAEVQQLLSEHHHAA
jgi:hypothetical protein